MAEKLTAKQELSLHVAILKQLVTLATSGFGVVAALAWNSVIQEFVNTRIKPFLPAGSSLFSLVLYAVVVTVLAVLITYNLTKVIRRLEQTRNAEPVKPVKKS